MVNVLSLFDGISCGQVALERAGIKFKYYASEIDKYTIKITQKNYPSTTQLGDINNWKYWDIDFNSIDLVIGGSPCQGFSFAGKQLNFQDERSKLFFVFIDILNHIKKLNPNVKFLLENVKMKKEYRNVISSYLGVEPIEINSALVSAQNRKRLYWTNIEGVVQPEDKGILLKDIIDFSSGEKVQLNINQKNKLMNISTQSDKMGTLTEATVSRGCSSREYLSMLKRINMVEKDYIIQGAAIRNQVTKNGVEEQLNIRKDFKSNCVVPSYPHKLNGCVQIGEADIKAKDIIRRVYSPEGKCPALTAVCGGHQEKKISDDNITWRKLTPVECERLQTLPDNYTEGISNSQRYKSIGNGWTVDVIVHIINYLKF